MMTICLSHFRALDMVVLRNLSDSTVETTEQIMLRGLEKGIASEINYHLHSNRCSATGGCDCS